MKYFFKHPLKSLKAYLPHSMFGRSLLILVLPLILIETTAVYIFLDAHWDRVTKTIAKDIAGEVSTLIEIYEHTPTQKVFYKALADKHLRLEVDFTPDHSRALSVPHHLQNTALNLALKDQLTCPFTFDIQEREIFINVETSRGLVKFITPLSRFCNRGVILFIFWVVLTSAGFLLIAVAFMHNQVKPLRRLVIAADRFGKGRSFPPLRPEGAIEIRKLTNAFVGMRERLHKQLTQRTEMLAGVSHDLRTPLTRMRLQLTMMPLSPEIEGLQKDVEEMSKMLEGYLTFARGEGLEETRKTDINDLIIEAIEGRAYSHVMVHYTPISLPFVHAKTQALKRCLMNLINNGTRYGKRVWVSASATLDHLFIAIEDNGPGIPEDKKEDVFKPFFRLESSRNLATGGVGLGLTIARDIAHGHGGEISLSESEKGGLKAVLMLPY